MPIHIKGYFSRCDLLTIYVATFPAISMRFRVVSYWFPVLPYGFHMFRNGSRCFPVFSMIHVIPFRYPPRDTERNHMTGHVNVVKMFVVRCFILKACLSVYVIAAKYEIDNTRGIGRKFDGIGGLSGGGVSYNMHNARNIFER